MKRSVTIKAAWIGAIALIIAAIIGGLLSLKSGNHKNQTTNITTEGNVEGTFSVLQDTGSVTINYNVPDSATKDAIKELEKKLAVTDEKINLSRKEIALLTKALKDLDQRTSGIEKLPDGRTKLGHFVSGQPRIVIEEHDAAAHFFKQQNYVKALSHSQNAINAYEETNKKSFSMSTGGLTKEGVAMIYRLAALSAQRLDKRQLAYQYAKKSIEEENNAQNMALLSTTLANLGKKKEAIKYIEEALKADPDNREYIRLKDKYSRNM
jgi:tetratricopeptide (TPR) repeat protein